LKFWILLLEKFGAGFARFGSLPSVSGKIKAGIQKKSTALPGMLPFNAKSLLGC
jgi:hypothetical protein